MITLAASVLIIVLVSFLLIPQQQTLPKKTSKATLLPMESKNYINEDFGFEINYPSDWYLKTKNGEVDSNVVFILYIDRSPILQKDALLKDNSLNPWPDIRLIINKKRYNKNKIQRKGMVKTGHFGPIIFAGIPANKFVPIVNSGNIRTEIIFNYSNYGWEISYPITADNGKHDLVYDQILSTFKFLD